MMTCIYWICVIAYSAVVVYIGYAVHRRYRAEKTEQDNPQLEFWLAKRSLPGWRLGISLTAGWLMLGWIGFGMSQIYMYGVTGLWILPVPWFILCFIIIVAVPYIRRIGAVSLPQAIEKRYGISARTLLAVFSAFVFISWTQAELFMAGTLLSPFLKIEPWMCMVLIIIPIILYTYLGGFRAIVTTDVLQFSLMVVFMIILGGSAVYLAYIASDGAILTTLKNTAPPWAGEGAVFNPWVLGWLFPLVLLVGYLPGWLLEQDLCVRLQAAESTREARKGAVLALVLITVFIVVIPAIAALCALVVFPPVNGAPPELLDPNAYSIISAFIAALHPAFSLFMVVGLLACQMSTVDSFANVSAMPVAYDIIEPMMQRRGLSPQKRLNMAKIVSVFALLIGLCLAFTSESLGDVYYISSGVLSASIALPALFIFWKRTTLPAVLSGSVIGFIGTVGGYWFEYKYLSAEAASSHYYINILPQILQGSYGYNYIVTGVLFSFFTIIVISLVTKSSYERVRASISNEPIDAYDAFVTSLTNTNNKGN